MSIHALSYLLTFIEAIELQMLPVDVRVVIFPVSVLKLLFARASADPPPASQLIKSLRERVRFFHNCGFPSLLSRKNVSMEPSLSDFMEMVSKLKAEVHRRHEYSSTMMPLSQLVDSPIQNTNLAERLANVKNILRNQLYYSPGADVQAIAQRAERASTIFMFELVKNSYQHAFPFQNPRTNVRGYAAAQVGHFPAAKHAQTRMKTFARLIGVEGVDRLAQHELENKIRFLSMTISDFGIGLASRVRSDLKNGLQEAAALHATYDGSNENEMGTLAKVESSLKELSQSAASDLLIFAATTPYTSKMGLSSKSPTEMLEWLQQGAEQIQRALRNMEIADENKQVWSECVQMIESGELIRRILHPAGFGLGYCLVFVAEHFGSLAVAADNVEVTFNGRADAFTALKTGKYDLTTALNVLRRTPDELLEIGVANLGAERAFPGTQITVDIPVCFRWADQDPEFLGEEERENTEIYEQLFGQPRR